MTEWIQFSHDWAYYITPDNFDMHQIRGKVPVGSIVLTKEQEVLDTGVTITNTDYKIAKDGNIIGLEDKRAASRILARLFVDYMKKHNEYPPNSSFEKACKNGNVDVLFRASDFDKFKLRFTPELVHGDPEEFLMKLSKTSSRKKFSPGDNWKIEPAKSSRSICKTCGHKIEKDHVRLGEPTYYQDHLNCKWHHFDCKAEDIWGIPEDKLDGYASLSSEQKDKVVQALWK